MKLEEHIRDAIKDEFMVKHLSGNLMDTVEIGENEVRIPAPAYNMYRYMKDKVIIHTGLGSYASKLNDEGSEIFIYFGHGSKKLKPHNHVGYIDSTIVEGISRWALENGYKVEVELR